MGRLSAEMGNAQAQFEIGELMMTGDPSIKPDLRTAKRWLTKAQNNGNAKVQDAAKALLADMAAAKDYDTKPFQKMEDLEHGDAVLASFLCGLADHWAVFDKDNPGGPCFIELSRVGPRGAIIARPFHEWMERWKKGCPQQVVWAHRAIDGEGAVFRARQKLGTDLTYALFARSNDPTFQNCEAFARSCHFKMSRSSQAEAYVGSLLTLIALLLTEVFIAVWILDLWGLRYPVGFIVSLPIMRLTALPVLNFVLFNLVGSTSTYR